MIKSLKDSSWHFFAILVHCLWLYPVIFSGFAADDILNQQVRGAIPVQFKSVFDLTHFYFSSWVSGQGRFFPLAWYGYGLFYYLDSLILYKLLIVLASLISSFLLSYFISQIINSKKFSLLVISLFPLLIQVRLGNDPMISYAFLVQIVLVYTLLSLICLKKYLDTDYKTYLAISVILYLCALLTYEISYVFFLFHFVLVFAYYKSGKLGKKKSLFVTILYLFLSILMVVISLFLRSKASGIAPQYTISFDLTKYFITLFKQISASIPLTYFMVLPPEIASINRLFEDLRLFDFVITFFCTLIFFKSISSFCNKKIERDDWFVLFLYALLFLFLPAIIIAFSPRHHEWTQFGIGYLPVFIQYFGMALLLALIVEKIISWSKKMVLILCVLFYSVCILTFEVNFNVVKKINAENYFPIKIYEHLLGSKYFEDVKSGSTIIFPVYSHWNTKEFVYMKTMKNVTVFTVDEYIKSEKCKSNCINTYYINYFYDLSGKSFFDFNSVVGVVKGQIQFGAKNRMEVNLNNIVTDFDKLYPM